MKGHTKKSPGKKDWKQKVARPFKTVLAAVFFAAAPVGAQQAQQDTIPPSQDHAALLADLRKEFSRTALGKDMLSFADRQKITITFDTGVRERGRLGEYVDSLVRLHPGLNQEEMVVTLAHELRHAWQDRVLRSEDLREKKLTPTQTWAVLRYTEADACAYGTYFWADRLRNLKIEKTSIAVGTSELPMAIEMRNEMRSFDGLTAEEYLELGLGRCFQKIGLYNAEHLGYLGFKEQEFKNALVEAAQKYDAGDIAGMRVIVEGLNKELKDAPDDGDLERFLRKFGGMTFRVNEETALKSWDFSRDKIVREIPFITSDVPAENVLPIAEVKAEIARLEEVRTTLKMYLDRFNDALKQHDLAAKQPTVQTPRPPSV